MIASVGGLLIASDHASLNKELLILIRILTNIWRNLAHIRTKNYRGRRTGVTLQWRLTHASRSPWYICEVFFTMFFYCVLFVIIWLLIKNYMFCPESRIPSEGPTDKGEPDIHVVEDNLKVEEALLHLHLDVFQEKPYIMGFDCEWNASTQKHQPRAPVSLLQLATKNRVALFRLNKLAGFPLALKDYLSRKSIIFVGVGCDKDVENLYHDYKVNVSI